MIKFVRYIANFICFFLINVHLNASQISTANNNQLLGTLYADYNNDFLSWKKLPPFEEYADPSSLHMNQIIVGEKFNQYDLNDNFTYFYVKKADSSRVYGLELENLLSPYNLNFLINKDTLIEEHVVGIPGDEFFEDHLKNCNSSEKSQIAKEFVKFNERCMIRLLGDMRSYNYVIIPTHDFDQVVYKIRAIDFDQQCFEGNLKVYRPQFFNENKPVMSLVKEKLDSKSVDQYKIEERSIIAKRILSSETRTKRILKCMISDNISSKENIKILAKQIYSLTRDDNFKKVINMGEILKASFNYVLRNYENHEMLSVN